MYVLISSDSPALLTDKAMAIGQPTTMGDLSVSKANGNCGYKSDGLGGYVDDPNYTGIASADTVIVSTGKVNGQRKEEVFFMGAVAHGTKLSAWTVQLGGETCMETISGVNYYFKKYSVVAS